MKTSMKRKKLLSLVLSLAMAVSLAAPAMAAETDGGEVTILYTNDVHTYINEDLTYSKVAAYRDTLDNVLLVDAGDHIQGTAYGGLDNGETITGANQENAAFSAGTCAERSACFYAHANYPEARFEAIAIAARAEDGDFVADPVSPCGVCRQALLEYEVLAKHPVPVWLAGRNCVYRLPSVASLLPLAFSEF